MMLLKNNYKYPRIIWPGMKPLQNLTREEMKIILDKCLRIEEKGGEE